MNIFENITKALDKPYRLFSADNSIKACVENIDCPTSTDTPYLSSFIRMAPTEEADLSVNEFRQGFYQIDVNYPSHTGVTNLNEMADLLNAVFKTGACFDFEGVCLCITSNDFNIAGVSNGWVTGNMIINWNTYTNRL